MPTRVWTSLHQRARLSDRILAHAGTAPTAAWSLLAGIALIVGGLIPGLDVARVLPEVPDVIEVWMGAALAIGGTTALAGLLGDWRRRDRACAVEIAGWCLVIAGWAAWVMIVAWRHPESTVAWGSGLVAITVAALRIRVVVALDHLARRVLARLATRERRESADE